MIKLNYDIITALEKVNVIYVNESCLCGQLKLMDSLSEIIGTSIYIGKQGEKYKLFSPGGYLIAEYDTKMSKDGEISLGTFNKLAASCIAKEPEYIDHLPAQFFSKDFCHNVMASYKIELEQKLKPQKNIFGRISNKALKLQLKDMQERLVRYNKIYENGERRRIQKLNEKAM